MLCQKCHERQATVFISQTVNQETTQAHLCEVCAKEQTQLYGMNPANFNPFAALSNILTQVMGLQGNALPGGSPGRGNPATEPQIQCPQCGYQLSTFRQTGRLGCTRCYESFRSALEPLISGIYGQVRHVEQTEKPKTEEKESPAAEETPAPKRKKKTDASDAKTNELREKLQEAIKNEKYEEAAKLRDEIKKLEEK